MAKAKNKAAIPSNKKKVKKVKAPKCFHLRSIQIIEVLLNEKKSQYTLIHDGSFSKEEILDVLQQSIDNLKNAKP